ncbi:MAG: DinB family protein [Chloroflexi bacterium]|nr:DinB family protein [Chloroflexota bacterium]
MKELSEYRARLIERLVSAAREFRTACLAVRDPFAPLEGGWNVHQIATHTRDVHELVYGMRARRTAEEDNPEFQNFDGDTYMAEHYERDRPLQELLEGFVTSVEALAGRLADLPEEAWSRESRHAAFGSGFTLQTWVERGLAHIEEHLKTIKQGILDRTV